MTPADLRALADRVEGLPAPSRVTDADIWDVLGLSPRPLVAVGTSRLGEWEREKKDYYHDGANYHMADMSTWGQNKSAPAYTASLDAAMTLVGGNLLLGLSDILADGLPGCSIVTDTSTSPVIQYYGVCGERGTQTEILARCVTAASLRALASQQEQNP